MNEYPIAHPQLINIRVYSVNGIFNYYDIVKFSVIHKPDGLCNLLMDYGDGKIHCHWRDMDIHFQTFAQDVVWRKDEYGNDIVQAENFIFVYEEGTIERNGRLVHHDAEGYIA